MAASERLRAAILVALGVTGIASEARAEGGAYVSPGLLFGPVVTSPSGFSYGAELSFMYYARSSDWLGVGAFSQAQRLTAEGGFSRVAAGLQLGGAAGLELGAARRFASDERGATTDLHLAPFFSLGIVSFAVRVGVPIAGDEPRHGTEVALQVGLKLPIPVDDPPRFGMGSPGRPLTVARAGRVAPLARGTQAWSRHGIGMRQRSI